MVIDITNASRSRLMIWVAGSRRSLRHVPSPALRCFRDSITFLQMQLGAGSASGSQGVLYHTTTQSERWNAAVTMHSGFPLIQIGRFTERRSLPIEDAENGLIPYEPNQRHDYRASLRSRPRADVYDNLAHMSARCKMLKRSKSLIESKDTVDHRLQTANSDCPYQLFQSRPVSHRN